MTVPNGYTGRFAPTPSGPLHFGSIIAALGSYLDARSRNGRWLLRIDDLDTARVKPGAAEDILRSLESLGLYWDETPVYQDRRRDAYQAAEEQLGRLGLLYACTCPRRSVRGRPYPGTCRDSKIPADLQHALRLRVEKGKTVMHDRIREDLEQDLAREVGDFIIRRADGIHAYHLAVVVDDAFQAITHVVRGADLLSSCPRQIYLQKLLDLPTPVYAHLPLAVNSDGAKLSKQEFAEDALLGSAPSTVLYRCLVFLGQEPDGSLQGAPVEQLLDWAKANWKPAKIPTEPRIPVPGLFP